MPVNGHDTQELKTDHAQLCGSAEMHTPADLIKEAMFLVSGQTSQGP